MITPRPAWLDVRPRFPKGEATPEASLSLLHRDAPESVNANLLRGKTVPESSVRARLDIGELLTLETCGWHYVPGLRKDDDPKLAPIPAACIQACKPGKE